MAANFWLSPKSRPLTMEMVARLNDSQARTVIEELFWGVRGKQVCPRCGVLASHYKITLRGQYRCKEEGCNHTFSVTSNTPFKDHKIGHRKLLMAMLFFVTGHKGRSATDLCREIGVSYRTAFVLFHKLREGLMTTMSQEQLSGLVEIDGGHFSGRPRKGRKKRKRDAAIPGKYRQHRSKYPSQAFLHHPNRRIVMVLREKGKPGEGACRTIVAICRSENARDAEALVRKWVKPGTTIHSDEWNAYGNLDLMGYPHATVNHQIEFSTDDGISDNQAESFFSRMRRGVNGIYHRVTPRYMLDYACEMAWREDVRRKNTLQQIKNLVQRVFSAGISHDWRGYGQGNKRKVELLFCVERGPPS